MDRIFIDELKDHLNKEVSIFGWVHVRRDQGKMIFIDLRDTTGKVQMVVLPNHTEALEVAKNVRSEWVIKVTGKVNERPERARHDGLNGNLEIEVLGIEVVNEATTPPFEITEDTSNVDEEVRLKNRYIDLRTDRMHRNIKLRSEWVRYCREFLFENRFTEIETPILTASTPEGSRDFVVPSRLNKGKFYALPQSPQQYKQLLMSAGFDRYFQLARAIRDEDLRADRGFEHTQLDIEASFMTEEELLNLFESMLIHAGEKAGFVIKEKPFPRITYQEAMEKYGADKFDMRTPEDKEAGNVLAYAWVVDFPMFEKDDNGGWTFTHNPFSMPKEEFLEDLMKGENIENIIAQQYDLICNGYESGGGSVRAHKAEILEATYKIMGNTPAQIEEKVGHMLQAFKTGTPPHGGMAVGVERNVMNLTDETTLRDVQAFPMTRRGQTSVMNAPSELSTEQMIELGLKHERKN